MFLSNGPGDPAATAYGIAATKALLGKVPIFGICLGHQLLALALGGRTYKMKFGHRGVNQPVRDLATGAVEITSHNHGFAVDPAAWARDADGLAVTDQGRATSATGTSTTARSRASAASTCRRSACSTTPRPRPARTTPATCSRSSARLMEGALMPRRQDLHKIMVIGSGPIVIGQACEFDYSGTQACKVLREEGFEVSLVNSNPATIMTDPAFADRTYIEPLTPASVLAVLEREKPDAILPTLGGQTGLNVSVALAESGDLDRLGIRLIGASLEAIHKAEDRSGFQAR